MSAFDESLMTACAFLKHISPEERECIDAFIKCRAVVEWLRESMKEGINVFK